MANLTDLSDIINRVTGGSDGAPEHLFFFKDNRIGDGVAVNTIAGRMTSLWQYNGNPAGGNIPTVAENPVNTTPGSLLHTNPAEGKDKWLLGVVAGGLNAGTVLLFDRLMHCGGLDGSLDTVQEVNGAISRNLSGVGNLIQIEIYSILGTTGRTIIVNYTNEQGQPSVSPPVVLGGTGVREAQSLISVPLATGDKGVLSVQSVQLSLSTGAAGEFGVNIVNPIAVLPLALPGTGSVRDFITGLPSIPRIDVDACLFFGWLASTTAPPQISGSMHFIEK